MIDLAILGGGPAGYVAAERAGAKGLNVVLFEKNALGGVCLNEGCVPTKTLLYSAKVYDTALHGKKYGVTVDGASVDFTQVMQRKAKVVRKLVAGIKSAMKTHHVEVVSGRARICGRDEQGIRIECNGETYQACHLLVCTGSEAVVPPIPGLVEAGAMTNREVLNLKTLPQSLVVIGGGVIGMEFASFFNSMGCQVTVVEMLPEILGGLDGEVSAMLRQIYAQKGVTFHLSSRVTRVETTAEGKVVHFTDKDGAEGWVTAAELLVSVGRRPVTKDLGLESLGVELVRGGIKVDDRMCTNVPHVYAAGDVTGFSLLAHTASREGEVVVNNLLGGQDRMRYKAIPGVVYTNPEVAGVGLTEEAAKAQGIDFKVLKLPMAYSGRFVAENEGGTGLCKLIVGDRGQVLGAHLLGGPAGEIIYGACMAIETEMTVDQFKEVVFPHPTVAEIIKETLFAE